VKVCIVGAGDGAIFAARRIHRLDREAQIDVFSKRREIGGPPCEMPLVLSGAIANWDIHSSSRSKSLSGQRNINVHLNTEVTEILRQQKCLIAGGETYGYDKAILDLGSIPSIPPIPGLDGKNEFTLSTDVDDGKTLGEIISKHSSAAIVGAGFIGLEIANALVARGYKAIYVLEIGEHVLPACLDKDMADKVEAVIREKGVELILPVRINGINSERGEKRVILPHRELEADFVFFATGVRPNVELARKAGLQIGETGAIAVNQYLQTSDPDIYAVGDCMENWDMITGSKRRHQLAFNAIRNGDIAGRNLVSGNSFAYEGTVMPFVTKIFGHQVGAVGFTERSAREKGLDVVSVPFTTPWLRQKFGGKPADCKLIADRETQTLIGVQIISEEMVGGAIDKFAVAIAERTPLVRLVQIDSCYSPAVQQDRLMTAIEQLIDELG
jgi:NADH oxidase (H2O2-forming)